MSRWFVDFLTRVDRAVHWCTAICGETTSVRLRVVVVLLRATAIHAVASACHMSRGSAFLFLLFCFLASVILSTKQGNGSSKVQASWPAISYSEAQVMAGHANDIWSNDIAMPRSESNATSLPAALTQLVRYKESPYGPRCYAVKAV